MLRAERVTDRLARLVLAGEELRGFACEQPAASVRLLLPSPGAEELVIPTWTGNEFLLPTGQRPVLRTFTPRLADPEAGRLTVDVVVHGHGAASEWAAGANTGAPVAVSGPGRGYTVSPDARSWLIAGDETAVPAIGQLLERLPAGSEAAVLIEIPAGAPRPPLSVPAGAALTWCPLAPEAGPGAALLAEVAAQGVEPGTTVWAAGEAAAMHRLRRLLHDTLGLPRASTTVRGYWKHGRAAAED